jgi:hypothetical protein
MNQADGKNTVANQHEAYNNHEVVRSMLQDRVKCMEQIKRRTFTRFIFLYTLWRLRYVLIQTFLAFRAPGRNVYFDSADVDSLLISRCRLGNIQVFKKELYNCIPNVIV